ncbi:MAG: hypothetical protein V2J16_03380, partial [Thermoleophilia bacterium]|nr:hypothetical protein [Thermoleophilia bacterium]
MNTLSRQYLPGDEVQINRLYRSIAGRERDAAQFAWEWLDTWAGQGSMNLVFDLDREEGDQLVAQYSLIPTPLSVWGRPTVAGKTENCMSHPDHRGSGLYSAHERACFEKEKEKYSFFFTTAGEVAGGAVGRVRVKLGYIPFDNWVKYTLWLRTGALREELGAMVAGKGRAGKALAPVLGGLLAAVLQAYSRLRRRRTCGYRVVVHGEADAPLEEIAALWERNRRCYGITVDRRADYLRWRVNDDPYIEHEYLTMHDGDGLLGYVISYVQRDTLYVVDVLVDAARTDLFRHLLAALVRRGRELGVARLRCVTLRHSELLPRSLRSAGFLDTAVLWPTAFISSRRPRQFFLYIPEELRDDPKVSDRAGWYLTELVLEERLRGAS